MVNLANIVLNCSSSSSMLFLCSFSKEYYTEAWVLVVEKKDKRENARCMLKGKSMIVLFKESRSPWQP